ncbi:hypothetical protein [Lutibacter sp.]|uniref:hypothetical protein n=1 Tax=Lutibacter sp. TaxID=1925666 RepID=UPI00299D8984|nr:hypothetical protein [Lutibacter sp.]
MSKMKKGTKKAPNNSVKNQMQYTKNSKIKSNLLQLLENLEQQILRSQAYLIDDNQIREHDQYLRKLKHIKTVATADPRFPYQKLQLTIDNLYRNSPVKPKRITVVIPVYQLINPSEFNPEVYGI